MAVIVISVELYNIIIYLYVSLCLKTFASGGTFFLKCAGKHLQL